MRSRRFLLVACSGPDGAGKTTLARGAVEELRAAGTPARYHWMRLGTSPFLELVKKVAPVPGRKDAGAGGRATPDKEALGGRPRLRLLWGWVLAVDYLARVWTKVLVARVAGGVHVMDRYAVDAAVDLRVTYGFPRSRLLIALAPRPSVSVLVTAEGVDLHRRGETPADRATLERSQAAYEEWASAFTHRIDTAVPGTDGAAQLARLALGALSR